MPNVKPKSDPSKTGVEGRKKNGLPVVAGVLTIDPPKGLRQDAKDAWITAIQNAPKGMLTALDCSVLERWCRSYALYRKLARMVEDSDSVVLDDDPSKLHGNFAAMIKVSTMLAAAEKELGFTPVSRARVCVREEQDEGNEFGGF